MGRFHQYKQDSKSRVQLQVFIEFCPLRSTLFYFYDIPVFVYLCFCSVLSVCLCMDTLSLSVTHTHTLSLGYYQDKSIWSIQGSGCHFIHIFSSLVTLLKATASIYPEWMNAPTDETQGKMRPTQTEMTTANQSVIFKHVLKFCVLYAIKNSLVMLKLLAQCFLFICEWRDRELPARLPMTRERLLRLPAWGEKWDVTVSGGTEQRKLETRQKCVYSCQLNWCPDPPPGCRCLLSGEGIKGPFTRHEDFCSTRPRAFLLSSTCDAFILAMLAGEKGNFPMRLIQKM